MSTEKRNASANFLSGAPHLSNSSEHKSFNIEEGDGSGDKPGTNERVILLASGEQVRGFEDANLFFESSEQWFRRQHPEWSDEEIRSAVVLVESANLIESYEEINEHHGEVEEVQVDG